MPAHKRSLLNNLASGKGKFCAIEVKKRGNRFVVSYRFVSLSLFLAQTKCCVLWESGRVIKRSLFMSLTCAKWLCSRWKGKHVARSTVRWTLASFPKQFNFYYNCKPIHWYWFAHLLNDERKVDRQKTKSRGRKTKKKNCIPFKWWWSFCHKDLNL